MKRLPYSLQIVNGISIGIGYAIEVEEDGRTVWFCREQIIEAETKLLREVAYRCMPLIDEFAAVFCIVSVREIITVGPTTAAQARVRFINGGDNATSLQTISAGQSSQTGSDHGDPRAGCNLSCTEQ
jgi:hypothetical protein